MAYPEHYVSSAIVNVAVDTTSKIVFLPPANTVVGKTFLIRDSTGACGTNFIYISTLSGNTMNNTTNFVTMSIPYQSFRVVAQNTSNYAVIQNDLQGHFWLDS
jgi:hypothetical protein